jgi:DNA gyrase/topoisomerase IV subunit A
MDTSLPHLYKDYGQYSNYRNFPLDIDGLKPVERRVLLSAYKIARAKYVKSRQVDAYTIGHYHPHGECYGTIVQMVRQGFLDGQGNFGTNVGVEPVGPAAPRYTECKMSQSTIDMMFKYIKYAPIVDTELGDREPVYLPTMFPVCLMGNDYTQGIGFGYKTFIPCYNLKDLHQRLLWLLGVRKRKPIITPITDCNILSPPDVVESLLTTGSAKIEVEGVIDVNQRTSTLTLKSWPPGKRFESFLNKFAKELNENMIGFTDLSVSQTEITFQVLRERNRVKIFEEFVEKMKDAITGFISFEMVMVDSNQKVFTKSVDDMLLDTYNMFCVMNDEMLNQELKRLREQVDEYQILEKIKPHLIKCIGDKIPLEESIDIICKKVNLPNELISMLVDKYKIRKLLTLDTDTTEIENKIKELLNNIANIDKFVLDQYDSITK